MTEFDSPNYAEYVYDRKNEGKVLLYKVLMICADLAFVGGFAVFCAITRIWPIFALCPLLFYILYLCTWRFVSYDSYFELKEGVLELGNIKLKKSDRKKFPKLNLRAKEAKLIAAYDEVAEQVKNIKTVYDFSESKLSPHRIALVFDKDGKECLAIFEGTAKAAKILASLCENGKSLKGKTFHG